MDALAGLSLTETRKALTEGEIFGSLSTFAWPMAKDHTIATIQYGVDTVKEKETEMNAIKVSKVTYGTTKTIDTCIMLPRIKKVIFNPPATVVIWEDGTKTVVKAGSYSKVGRSKDKFSEEYGLAMAIAKKFCGNRSRFLKLVKNASRPQKEK